MLTPTYLSSCGRWAFVLEHLSMKPFRFLRVPVAVLEHECPMCGAEKGRPCVSRTGSPKTEVHYTRKHTKYSRRTP